MDSDSTGPDSHITDNTSLTLLQRVREKDAVAWQRLLDLYSPLVFHWCRRCNLSSEDSGDIVQDVFVNVARKVHDFRRSEQGDSFRGWLRTITRNQIRMHFRKNRDRPGAVGGSTINAKIQQIPDPQIDDSTCDSGNERHMIYHRALDLLQTEFEERTWKAFVQFAIEERPASDVAAALNMTSGAVRQAKYKVLRRLKAEVDELLD